jgi:hypothetical protein
MRRLLIAAAVALAALVGLAAPASANHDNWNWQINIDAFETYNYVDSYSSSFWDIGLSSMNSCGVSIKNLRPDAHSARIQYLSRASGFVAWDIVVSNINPGQLWHTTPPPSNIAISSEPYIRYKWGDGAYGWREIDYFYNHPADQVELHAHGYYCP